MLNFQTSNNSWTTHKEKRLNYTVRSTYFLIRGSYNRVALAEGFSSSWTNKINVFVAVPVHWLENYIKLLSSRP